jgi:hypothetical protein
VFGSVGIANSLPLPHTFQFSYSLSDTDWVSFADGHFFHFPYVFTFGYADSFQFGDEFHHSFVYGDSHSDRNWIGHSRSDSLDHSVAFAVPFDHSQFDQNGDWQLHGLPFHFHFLFPFEFSDSFDFSFQFAKRHSNSHYQVRLKIRH